MTLSRPVRKKKSSGENSARRVLIAAYHGVASLDVTGPLSVFAGASYVLASQGAPGYECDIVSMRGGLVTTDLGAQFMSRRARDSVRRSFDTLLIPGAPDLRPALEDKEFIAWIAENGPKARRLCSVCGGASPLAASGLADGRRLATHWINCDSLQNLRPAVKVERDPIYVQDGAIWSSAGVTAGIDMSLALVEDDYGRDVAMAVARFHVVYLKRPGGQ